MRRSKQEILELYRALVDKLGKPPGIQTFCKATRIGIEDVEYYWPRTSSLVKEAGHIPNVFNTRLSDDDVFRDYAQVCLHLGKIPTTRELKISQRELKTRTSTVYSRLGSINRFQDRFREWLKTSTPEHQSILDFTGWAAPRNGDANRSELLSNDAGYPHPQFHPFLPACLQYFDVLARGDLPRYEATDIPVSSLFERRTADAFRCLGFETQLLGQGTGRNPDVLAIARQERFALIIDAKVRKSGYVLGTEDRKFLDYATSQGNELQRQGSERVYFVVIGPFFRESDLSKLSDHLSDAPIRGVTMITASAIMQRVEDSIRNRNQFTLRDFEKTLFGNKIVA